MTLTARKHLDHIPDDLDFFPHQIEGVRILSKRSSFILADDMGLGKSLTALTVAAVDWHQHIAKRGLIVCPASLKWNWFDEIAEHTLFKAIVLSGTPHKRRQTLEHFGAGGYDWLIVNYEQVQAHTVELNRLGFDVVIADEAHYIKSPDSIRHRAVMRLVAPRWFLLTGSPLLNHVDDLWALLHRIEPEQYPNYYAFLNRYAVYGGWKNKQIVGIANSAELKARVAQVMLRRLKSDCLDLPAKQHITVTVNLLPAQQKLYDEAMEELRITIPGDPNPLEIENVLVKLLRLKMICGTTSAIDPTFGDHSAKLDVAMEKVEEMVIKRGEKLVVFTQFREVQRALMARLAKKKVKAHELHGDVKPELRKAVVDAWSADGPAVFVVMLQVGGVGLTMTAARACIFLDELYSPKMNEQAEDRLHRIGASTTQPVQIIHIRARGTVDTRIQQILKRKRDIFDQVAGGDSAWKRKLIQALIDNEPEEAAA